MDRAVKVRVDFAAGGNLSTYVGEAKKQVSSLSDLIKKADRPQVTFHRAGMPSGNKVGFSGDRQALLNLVHKNAPTASLPMAKPATDVYQKQLADNLSKFSLSLSAATVAAVGFAAAASPAVSQTLTGSMRLLAGEIGIALIPAVVKASEMLQTAATITRNVNDATGGFLGSLLKAATVPAVILGIGAAAVYGTKMLWNLAAAAAGAANGISGSGFMGKYAAGGFTSQGMAARFGAATLGIAASQTVGGAIGGQAGSMVSGIGTGASIGGAVGSFGGAPGIAIGVIAGGIIGAIVSGFDKAAAHSFNFTGGGGHDISDLVEQVQREAIRDPMQQREAELLARSNEELARQIGYLAQRINIPAWQVGS